MRPPPTRVPSLLIASLVVASLLAPAAGAAATATTPTANDTPTPTPTANDTATPTPTPTPTPTATPANGSGPAPDLALSNLSAPARVRAGSTYAVAVTATNRGGNGTARLAYDLGGTTAAERRVDLDAGASTRVRFRIDLGNGSAPAAGTEPGSHVHGVRNASGAGPATRLRVTPDVDLSVASFEAPTGVLRGEEFVVVATVANPAAESFTRTVAYRFDGATVIERDVTVPANGTATVALAVSVARIESVVGPVANGTTHDHAVVAPGGARAGDAVRIRRGPSAAADALAVESLSLPDDVGPGDRVLVNVTVRNVATTPFEGQVAYRVAGTTVATGFARVPVGERRRLTLRASYAGVREAAASLPARGIDHGVWIGSTPLERRPVTVRAPPSTPTATATAAAAFTPRATTDTPSPTAAAGSGAATAAATATADGRCERGFVSRCGGTSLDQTTLTVIGVVSSVLGMLYELFQGG
jgi:hypothetical protein